MPSPSMSQPKIFSELSRVAFPGGDRCFQMLIIVLRVDVKEWLDKAGIDPNRKPNTLNTNKRTHLLNTFDFLKVLC